VSGRVERRLRITAGRWKGRGVEAPAGARPTSERARQALFDILGDRVPGAWVLDLYAGSGAVGLEAVSRGAARAVLVETDAEPLRRTLARLAAPAEQVALRRQDAAAAIRDFLAAGDTFDIVFADPPYAHSLEADGWNRVGALLRRGGLAVLQRDAGSEAPPLPGARALEARPYGRNVFHFFGML
jgi:16S rRNA (guanine966-N2)-methyltransferase